MSLERLTLTGLLSLVLFISNPCSLLCQTLDSHKTTFTNHDVVDLLKAGLSSEIVIAKIKSSFCVFDTSPAALVDLKNANVPDSVILVMVQVPESQVATKETSFSRPTVQQILDKYVQALGGEANIRKSVSAYMSGTLEYQDKTLIFQKYSKAPNKTLLVRTTPGVTPLSDGFDGLVRWSDYALNNSVQMTVQEMGVAARDADSIRPFD